MGIYDVLEARALSDLNPIESKNFQRKKTMKFVFKQFLFFCAFLAFSNAKLSGSIAPFAVGFAFSLLILKENPLIFGWFFVAAQVAVSFSFQSLIIAFCFFSAMLTLFLIHNIAKKPVKLWSAFLALAIGSIAYVYFHISTQIEIVQTLLFVLLAGVFLYVCFWLLRAVYARGILAKFTIDECVCLSIFVMALCLGLFNVRIVGVSVETILICFFILLVSKLFGSKNSLYLAALAGLGLAFANNSIIPLAIFCAWAVMISALNSSNKIFMVCGVVLIDFLLGAYFNGYASYTLENLIAICIPCVAFLLIPNSIMSKFQQNFDAEWRFAGAYLVDFDRGLMKNKMNNTAKIFANMGEVYKKMAAVETTDEDVKSMLSNDVINRICRNCDNFSKCLREKNLLNEIDSLVSVASTKNKASLIDVSKNIAVNCNKTSSLLSAVNASIQNFKQKEITLENEDKSRESIGEQLLGTSKILLKMAQEFSAISSTNKELANRIAEELLCFDIVTKDSVVLEDNSGISSIVLVTKRTSDFEMIEKTISKMLKIQFSIKCFDAKQAGWKIVILEPASKFDIVVGVHSANKNRGEISGDSHAFVDLGSNKFLIAVCDGMGAGKTAKEASERTIQLIENFYRAGFDSDIILSTVTKLLSTSGREVFSTLDICVLDANTGGADFVKACAPPTVIKRGDEAFLVQSESLPIGIVNEKPFTVMQLLQSGDIVILASDGVFDSFANSEEYLNFCNNERLVNMNLLSESIVEEAILKNGGIVKDDMTVICLRAL